MKNQHQAGDKEIEIASRQHIFKTKNVLLDKIYMRILSVCTVTTNEKFIIKKRDSQDDVNVNKGKDINLQN